MKKVILISSLQDVPEDFEGQVIGFVSKDPKTQKPVFHLQNLEVKPNTAVDFEFSESVLTLKIKFKPGEILVIGDAEGVSTKTVLQSV